MRNTKSAESAKAYITAFLIFAVGLVSALPLRCYQLFNLLDSTTGFYTKASITVPVLNVILLAVTVLSILTAYLGKKTVSRPLGRNIPVAAATFLFAFSLIFDGINKLFDGSLNGFRLSDGFVLAQGGFALLASLFFIIVGISFAVGTDTFIRRGILAVTPVFWAVSRVLQRFSIAIDFKNVSEILFELAMLCLAMLFFIAFARVYVSRAGESLSWRITAFGIPAALFAFLCSVPRFLLKLVGLPERIVKDSPPVFADFCMAIFIVAVMIAFVSDRRDPDLIPEETAEAESNGEEDEVAYVSEAEYEAGLASVRDAATHAVREDESKAEAVAEEAEEADEEPFDNSIYSRRDGN